MIAKDTNADTFTKLLQLNAKQRGERPAIREKSRGIWRTTTWRDLSDEAAAIAVALHAKGLGRGAAIAFTSENRPRLYAAMCAAHWLGAIVVPLFQDSTPSEMAAALQIAYVTHVFAEDQEQVDKVLGLLPQCPLIQCIVYDKDRGMRHYKQPQIVSYDALLQLGKAAVGSKREFLSAEVGLGTGQDAACIFFTSGATGPSKAVVLTHAALIDRARAVAALDGLNEADVTLAYLPPAWIGQNLVGYAQPLAVGYCVCCPESSETMLADLREIGPTYFLAPPRVLETIVNQVAIRMDGSSVWKRGLYSSSIGLARRVGADILSGRDVGVGSRLAYNIANLLVYAPLRGVLGMSNIRVAYTTGDAIAPHVLMFFRSIGINLKQVYGSTETGFFVAVQRNGEVDAETVGPPTAGVELKFSPQREILVRSAGLLKSYHGDAAATHQALAADGWFHTGDAGFLGEDGKLRIIDRLSDVGVMSDGSFFAPKLIENRIKASPFVKEAVAFGAGRAMVCALIDIDMPAVGNWADQRSISYAGHADLASRDEVYAHISDWIAKVNADLATAPELAGMQIRRFLILHKELDADDGVLTRMRKLRRNAVATRYGPLVEAMHAGTVSLEFFDGDESAPLIAMTIRDAAVFPAKPAKKAA